MLDMDLDNHPALMVLKYVKLNHSSVKVVLIFKSKADFNNSGISKEDLTRMGASSILVKPFKESELVNSILGARFDSWKSIQAQPSSEHNEKIMLLKDEEFTRIKLDKCQSGSVTIFDHFIRLGPGRYVLVMRRGDPFDHSRIDKYKNENKIEYIYFKTKDRTTYINYMNEMLKKSLHLKQHTLQIISTTKTVTEKFIEEVYTTGLKPELVLEGKKICESIHEIVRHDRTMFNYMREFEEFDPSGYSHSFLVSFFSAVICKNLEWTTSRTTEIVTMGALFHDLGKIKLPPTLRNVEESNVPASQVALFRQHPFLGVELFEKSKISNDAIKHIILQHHESINGEGFPYALQGSKIYPLAKIVALADAFAEILTSRKVTPLNAARMLIADKHFLARFDPLVVKSLVMGMVK